MDGGGLRERSSAQSQLQLLKAWFQKKESIDRNIYDNAETPKTWN